MLMRAQDGMTAPTCEDEQQNRDSAEKIVERVVLSEFAETKTWTANVHNCLREQDGLKRRDDSDLRTEHNVKRLVASDLRGRRRSRLVDYDL